MIRYTNKAKTYRIYYTANGKVSNDPLTYSKSLMSLLKTIFYRGKKDGWIIPAAKINADYTIANPDGYLVSLEDIKAAMQLVR